MGAAALGDRLLEVTQKPFLGPGSLSLQCRHWESSKAVAGLDAHSVHSLLFRSCRGSSEGGQQQFATQTLRVHLLGIDVMPKRPESEILAKFFADMGKKCGEKTATFVADFRPSISRKSGRKKFREKLATNSAGREISHPAAKGGRQKGGGKRG